MVEGAVAAVGAALVAVACGVAAVVGVAAQVWTWPAWGTAAARTNWPKPICSHELPPAVSVHSTGTAAPSAATPTTAAAVSGAASTSTGSFPTIFESRTSPVHR